MRGYHDPTFSWCSGVPQGLKTSVPVFHWADGILVLEQTFLATLLNYFWEGGRYVLQLETKSGLLKKTKTMMKSISRNEGVDEMFFNLLCPWHSLMKYTLSRSNDPRCQLTIMKLFKNCDFFSKSQVMVRPFRTWIPC